MRKELVKKLCDAYPSIFADSLFAMHVPIHSRFCCGDGWFDLIDMLCSRIEISVLQSYASRLIIDSVEEHDGTIRICYDGGSDLIFGMVVMAEEMSSKLCEVCGNAGSLESIRTPSKEGVLFQVRCKEHRGMLIDRSGNQS